MLAPFSPIVLRARRNGRLLLSSSLLVLTVCGVLAPRPVVAAEIVVPGGATVGQQLLNPGDKLTVETGGKVTDNVIPVYDNNNPGSYAVINQGIIEADGIAISLDDLDLNNTGTVASTFDDAIYMHSGQVINSGLISGDNSAIHAATISLLDNASGGTIIGNGYGVQATNVGLIENAGLIDGGFIALSLTSLGTLNNDSTGSITNHNANQAAISVSTDAGVINNAGNITGEKLGIEISGHLGSLSNTGNVTSNDSGAGLSLYAGSIGSIDNAGYMGGGFYGIISNDIGSLANSGTIEGYDTGLFSANSIGSITNTGRITVSDVVAGVAVRASSISALTNAGDIGGGWEGINVANAIGSIVNSGRINAAYRGIAAQTIGSLDNSGLISGDRTVFANSHIGTVTNSGTITATSQALTSFGDLDSLANTGTITADFVGLAVQGQVGSVANSGLIHGDTAGMQASQFEVVQNSGTISGGGFGLRAGEISSLTNSGTIRAADPSGMAILEVSPNYDTLLTLNAGSILIGHVDISGGNDTLNVGDGLNLALTFDTSVPELIETNGAPYVVVGNTVHVADLDAFAAAGVATADLAGGIDGAVGGAVEEGFDEKGIDGQGHFWLQAIGGLGHNASTQTGSRYVGLVAGADFGPDAVTRFGAFGGASLGRVAETSNVSSFYAGIYGAGQFEDFAVRGTLTGGHTEADTDRIIANNTVIAGLETASSTQDAYFVAPGIIFSRPWVTQDLTFETSLALNYTGVFGQGFAEDLATGLRVDGFNTHVFEAEGLLRLPFQKTSESGTFSGDAHAGIEGRAVAIPDVIGSLAGTPMTLAAANTQVTAGLTAGGAVAFQWEGGASMFGGLDATLRSDGSVNLSANAGIKAPF